MNAAKTATQRVNEARARRAAAGLVRLELWIHPDDRAAIKLYAARLAAKRGKSPPTSG